MSTFKTMNADNVSQLWNKIKTVFATKSDISTVYRPKGTKTNYSDLPATGNEVGDVWNITNADSTHGVKAGDNVVYTSSGTWDNLSGVVDLSGYATTTDVSNSIQLIRRGKLDPTSTSTVMTATVEGITELVDGVTVLLENGVVTSASGVTLNINGLGAKPIYQTMAATSAVTTAFNVAYTMMFIYNSTRVTGGCWDLFYGYNTNTTYTNASLGQGYATCTTEEATKAKTASLSSYAATAGGYVAVKFTNAVPENATLNVNSKGAKAIYYNNAAITDGIIEAGDLAVFIYYNSQYHLVAIDRIIRDMPTKTSQLINDSGFITSGDIPEGSAASTTTPQMDGTAATGSELAFARGDHVHPTDTSRLSTSGDGSNVTAAFSAASSRSNIATGEKLSVLFGKIAKYFADLGSLAFKSEVAKTDLASGVQTSLDLADTALQSYTETDPTVPSWAKASSKPSYTASEVGAVPTSRTVNSKALSSNITLTASDVGALPDSTNIPSATSTSPKMNGTAAVGSETTWAKGDHVHPTDTGRQAKITASGILKGDGNGGVTAATAGTDYIASHQDISGKLDKSGGKMTGDLTLAGAPTSDLHAATKKYVDDNIGGGGGTITYGTVALTDGVSPLAAGTLYVQYYAGS